MQELTKWVLEGPPWVRYGALTDLLGQAPTSPEVLAARQAMLDDHQVQGLMAELAMWPGSVISSHRSAGHPLHKLVFLADLGLRVEDTGVGRIIPRILRHQSPESPFQVLMNIPLHYGGTGRDQWAWALCDAPLILYALVKFGLGEDHRVRDGIEHLTGLLRDNGWPCAVSPELGKFRGPGRKDDPCPYANLAMLKVLAQSPDRRSSKASRIGAEGLLTQWERRRDSHPYMFFMGTDFCKLKAPMIWFDLLHVLEVLTQFPRLRKDARLLEMVQLMRAKADKDGRFTPESIWSAWRDWEFGQKRVPSRWLTLLALRVIQRVGLKVP